MSTHSDPWHWKKRAELTIAQGALTNSKRPECLVRGIYPTHVKRGQGCHLWDMDGRKYVDYICGLGTSILGYGHTEVIRAATQAMENGPSLSFGTDQEVLLGEKLQECFPFVERVKLLKTGSEACLAAIRIARAKTGKRNVLSAGYHGWGDEFVSLSPPALGIPRIHDHIGAFDSLDADLEDVAAVIVEPVHLDASDRRGAWLRELRDRCTKAGVLLIFDEIITGFRTPRLSVSSYFDVTPDLVCFGKAIANGFPIAVVGGSSNVMNGQEYFVSSTYAGEMGSIAAALKTITLLQTKHKLTDLWLEGQRFLDRFNALWPGALKIEGYPTRGVFVAAPEIKALFWQEACRAGILFGPSWFFNFRHPEETDSVLSSCADIVTRIKTGSVRLEGELPASPFAARMRGNA